MCVTKIRMALSWKWNGTEFWWLYRFSRAKVGVCIFGFCGNISVVVFWIKWQKSFGQTKIVLTFLFLLIFWIASWIFWISSGFLPKGHTASAPKGREGQSQELEFYLLIFSPFVHWSEQSLPASSCLLPPCPNWTAAAVAPAQFKCLVWIGIWFKLGPCTIIFLNISTLDKYLSEMAHLWYDHLLLLLPCCVDKKWLPVHLWMVDMLGEIFNSCESQIKSG